MIFPVDSDADRICGMSFAKSEAEIVGRAARFVKAELKRGRDL
jgi:hypothetical protein